MSDRQEQIKNEFMEMAVEIARHYDDRLNQEWAKGYKDALMDAQQIIAGDMNIDEARERAGDTASVGFLIQELDAELIALDQKTKGDHR